MKLYTKDQIEQLITDCNCIKGNAYLQITEAFEELQPEYIVRECHECFGASFGDCQTCNRIVKVQPQLGLDSYGERKEE